MSETTREPDLILPAIPPFLDFKDGTALVAVRSLVEYETLLDTGYGPYSERLNRELQMYPQQFSIPQLVGFLNSPWPEWTEEFDQELIEDIFCYLSKTVGEKLIVEFKKRGLKSIELCGAQKSDCILFDYRLFKSKEERIESIVKEIFGEYPFYLLKGGPLDGGLFYLYILKDRQGKDLQSNPELPGLFEMINHVAGEMEKRARNRAQSDEIKYSLDRLLETATIKELHDFVAHQLPSLTYPEGSPEESHLRRFRNQVLYFFAQPLTHHINSLLPDLFSVTIEKGWVRAMDQNPRRITFDLQAANQNQTPHELLIDELKAVVPQAQFLLENRLTLCLSLDELPRLLSNTVVSATVANNHRRLQAVNVIGPDDDLR